LPRARGLRYQSRRPRVGETRPRHPQRGETDGEIPRGPDPRARRRDGARGGPCPTPSLSVETKKTRGEKTEHGEKTGGQKNRDEKTRGEKTGGEKSWGERVDEESETVGRRGS